MDEGGRGLPLSITVVGIVALIMALLMALIMALITLIVVATIMLSGQGAGIMPVIARTAWHSASVDSVGWCQTAKQHIMVASGGVAGEDTVAGVEVPALIGQQCPDMWNTGHINCVIWEKSPYSQHIINTTLMCYILFVFNYWE